MSEKIFMTRTGLLKTEEELEHLKVVRRKEISAKLKEARAQGDLSENAEYDAAMDEQRDVEARIEELEKLLKNIEVVDSDEVDLNEISIGCQVDVHMIERGVDTTFTIVGSKEASSRQRKLSNESPVGKALLGKRIGDEVEVETQAGIVTYRVVDIKKAGE